ncbi:MAG: ComEC/Rec2 family competence protein, partial [Muribaculaceae bacterium]|nr:ComEC/Rec2 family competence protein [Muribaculaceae bacterium]
YMVWHHVAFYYFNTFPLLFIPANLLTGILFPLILGGGIILSIFTAMGIKLSLFGYAVDLLHSLMQEGIDVLGSMDEAVMHQVFFPAAVIAPYAMAVIMLAAALHYRRRVLWIATGILTVTTFITAQSTIPSLPSAEMYIPSSLSPTTIIMRAGDRAWLYTPDSSRMEDMVAQANTRYSRFLTSRGCGDSFTAVTDTLDHVTFGICGNIISAVDRTIAIVDYRIPDRHDRRIHVDYALICQGFRGKIEDITVRLKPDTILLGTELHPARRKSLIRQCGDSIPYRDLLKEGLSEVW